MDCHQPSFRDDLYNYVGNLLHIHVAYIDTAFIKVSEDILSPKILTKHPIYKTYTKLIVKDFWKIDEVSSGALDGKALYKTGYVTGVTRGNFIMYFYIYTYYLTIFGYLYHVITVDISSLNGDSGAPTYTYKKLGPRGWAVELVGTLVGIHPPNPLQKVFVLVDGIREFAGITPLTL